MKQIVAKGGRRKGAPRSDRDTPFVCNLPKVLKSAELKYGPCLASCDLAERRLEPPREMWPRQAAHRRLRLPPGLPRLCRRELPPWRLLDWPSAKAFRPALPRFRGQMRGFF